MMLKGTRKLYINVAGGMSSTMSLFFGFVGILFDKQYQPVTGGKTADGDRRERTSTIIVGCMMCVKVS